MKGTQCQLFANDQDDDEVVHRRGFLRDIACVTFGAATVIAEAESNNREASAAAAYPLTDKDKDWEERYKKGGEWSAFIK